MKKLIILYAIIISISACNSKKDNFDASGAFEANEVIVSAQQSGQLLSLNIREGEQLNVNQEIGKIDVTDLQLQQAQTEAQIGSLQNKLNRSAPQTDLVQKQISVQQAQLDYLLKEQKRTENLLKADAATQKQLDDITAKVVESQRQLLVLQQQIVLNKSNVTTQNSSVLSQKAPLEKTIAQIQNEINKGVIINPVKGIVLTKYAYEGEMTSIGKALYKIANTDTLTLRAYITGAQLPTIKLNQSVTIKIDDGKGNYKKYKGTIYWVSYFL